MPKSSASSACVWGGPAVGACVRWLWPRNPLTGQFPAAYAALRRGWCTVHWGPDRPSRLTAPILRLYEHPVSADHNRPAAMIHVPIRDSSSDGLHASRVATRASGPSRTTLDSDPGADPGSVPGRGRGTTVVTGQSVDVKQPFVVAPAHDSALQAHVGVPVDAIEHGQADPRI
jgi:hypothetical protein